MMRAKDTHAVADTLIVPGCPPMGFEPQQLPLPPLQGSDVDDSTQFTDDTTAQWAVTKVSFAVWSQAGADRPGVEKTNQDSWVVEECGQEQDSRLFLGVFDGHGAQGHKVSRVLSKQLPATLAESAAFQAQDYHKALAPAFVSLNEDISHPASGIDCMLSGSTACTSILHQDGKLTVANVGDSRCILGRIDAYGKPSCIPLSRDHKPDLPAEAARIYAANGRVGAITVKGKPSGPKRVWLQNYDLPGLATSRSFGDKLGARCGVIAEPEVHEVYLCPTDKYLVLCSDGITDMLSNDDVIQHVHQAAQQGFSASEIAQRLVTEARKRWVIEEQGLADDCTAVVCLLTVESIGVDCSDPHNRRSCDVSSSLAPQQQEPRRHSYDVGVIAQAALRRPRPTVSSEVSAQGLPARVQAITPLPVAQYHAALHPYSLTAAQRGATIQTPTEAVAC